MSDDVAIDDLRTDDGGFDARSLKSTGSDRHVSTRDCYRLRVVLLRGMEIRDHTPAAHYKPSAAHSHATGDCSHTHAIPPLSHTTHGGNAPGSWVIDE